MPFFQQYDIPSEDERIKTPERWSSIDAEMMKRLKGGFENPKKEWYEHGHMVTCDKVVP